MKRILLIRHGQTEWNAQGRWQGQLEVPLSPTGAQQALALAEYLRDHPITAVYSSDLTRAADTAAAVAKLHNLKVKTDSRLRELHLGELQGLTYAEIGERHPDELTAMRDNYLNHVIKGGESRALLQARAYAALIEISGREDGPEIVLVSHGGTIRMLLLKLFGDDPSTTAMHIENTSVTTLEEDEGTWRLVEAPSIHHLQRTTTLPPGDGEQR